MLQAHQCDISQRDGLLLQSDISHSMGTPPKSAENALFALLKSLKPADTTFAAWAREAGVSSSFFQDVKNGKRPRLDNLEKVVKAAGMTLAEFHALETPGRPANAGASASVRVQADPLPFNPRVLPRDVPVMGTALGADLVIGEDGKAVAVERTILELVEPVDYLRRPIGIESRKDVYALYIVGHSMEPRFRDGDAVYVDGRRTPAIGDDVIVQMQQPAGDDQPEIISALVKRLVRRTAAYVELEQYQPALTFRIEARSIAAIHRVIPWGELLGI